MWASLLLVILCCLIVCAGLSNWRYSHRRGLYGTYPPIAHQQIPNQEKPQIRFRLDTPQLYGSANHTTCEDWGCRRNDVASTGIRNPVSIPWYWTATDNMLERNDQSAQIDIPSETLEVSLFVTIKFKGRFMGLFQHCGRSAYCILTPNKFPHSSPEAPRIIQMGETSTSEGGNYYQWILLANP